MKFLTILCRQTFLTYFSILLKFIAINTRFSATGRFNVKYSRTNQFKNSFSIFGARIWNSIPQSIRILPKHKFKVSLHQLSLHILELEDTYVDAATLFNKLSKMNVK